MRHALIILIHNNLYNLEIPTQIQSIPSKKHKKFVIKLVSGIPY